MAEYAGFGLVFSLKKHEEIGTESSSGAKLDLAFEYSLVIDFNIRHQLILLEHFEGRLPRTQVGHKEKRSPRKATSQSVKIHIC